MVTPVAGRIVAAQLRDTDSNVSRQSLHPLWQAVTRHLDRGTLAEFSSGLLPADIREVERDSQAECPLGVETGRRPAQPR
jgi:hypothetical protein